MRYLILICEIMRSCEPANFSTKLQKDASSAFGFEMASSGLFVVCDSSHKHLQAMGAL
jgi:hypothetical protein